MTGVLGSVARPLRVAIVGSGPSGFYAVSALFRSQLAVEVDMFDRLPSPFGLVRYGVAPDHPKIKNVIKVYEKEAVDPRFAFFGNVKVGRDISIDDLRRFYDAVIFACGAETDKPLNIPNENMRGSYTATEFVGWYNGHPDYQDRHFDLSSPVAVIVGLGNVAMDVARILLKPIAELQKTDITQYSLDQLAKSKVKEVHIIGRRGPVQSAFTPAEIKEFNEIENCTPIVKAEDLQLNAASQEELADPKFPVRKKNFDILEKYVSLPDTPTDKKVIFHFLKSPVDIQGQGKVERIILEKNVLSGQAGAQNAIGTKIFEELACGNIFRSVGYRGVAMEGVPFDKKKGVFLNTAGRITSDDKPVPGFYVTGWIKRGPSGVVGTNKPDSEETVQNLLADVTTLKPCESPRRVSVEDFLKKRAINFINYPQWQKIKAVEIRRGELMGKPQEKFRTAQEMLDVVKTIE